MFFSFIFSQREKSCTAAHAGLHLCCFHKTKADFLMTWLVCSLPYSSLTHLCQMEFPTVINWTSPFLFYGLLGGFFSNLDRTICKHTLETLIRHHILWRLVWVCSNCLCPTKKMLQVNIWTQLHLSALGGIFKLMYGWNDSQQSDLDLHCLLMPFCPNTKSCLV